MLHHLCQLMTVSDLRCIHPWRESVMLGMLGAAAAGSVYVFSCRWQDADETASK